MNYLNIKNADMNNGPGLRVSIWCSGCTHACPGCFNEDLWNFNRGEPFTKETYEYMMSLVEGDGIDGVTLLGGEPLHPDNIEAMLKIAKGTKSRGKTVWCYTGYLYGQVKDLEIMQYIDVLVDGPFVAALYDSEYLWAGSTNQRHIDVQKTQKAGKIILKDLRLS